MDDQTIKDIREKILKGLALSYKRLVEEAARNNWDLIISKDGKPVAVSGKELLKKLSQLPQ